MSFVLRWRGFLRHLYRLHVLASFKGTYSLRNSPLTFRPDHYRTLASVAHKYIPNGEQDPKFDHVVAISVDEALSKIDLDAKQMGRVLKDHVRAVFGKIKESGAVSSIQSLYLIRCCGALMHDEIPSKRTELVNEMWSTFEKLNVPMDASHYNSLLKAYIDNGHQFSPTDVLSEMETKGITPNRVTYQRLIEKYCEDGDLSGASAVLEFMKEKDLAINEAVFNSLVKGYSKTGDFDGVKQVLESMRMSNLKPSIETYATIAYCYAEYGDIDQITSVFEEAEKHEFSFSTRHYLQIIYHLAVGNHSECVDKVLPKVTDLNQRRHECVNIILDLVNKGFVDIAYKVLLHANSFINFASGNSLFIKHLIATDQPLDKILKYCYDIETMGYNSNILSTAAKSALDTQKFEVAFGIFREMLKKGIPVRCHYFWPCFAMHQQQKNVEGTVATLKIMSDLGIPADFDTYFDYVVPSLSNHEPQDIIKLVKGTGQSEVAVMEPLLYHCCDQYNLENVLYLLENFNFPLNANYVVRILATHYTASKESKTSLVKVLDRLLESASLQMEYNDKRDFHGQFLLCLLECNKLTRQFLEDAYSLGFELSRSSVDMLCAQLRDKDPALMQLVRNLQYGVAPVPPAMKQRSGDDLHVRDMSIEDLEHHLMQRKKSGSSTRAVLRSLLSHYCRQKNINRILEVKKELDDQGYIFTPAAYALMIDAFVSVNNLEEALQLKQKLDSEYPDFKLDSVKTIDFATLLIKCNRIPDAEEVIKNYEACADGTREEVILKRITRLLNAVASTGNPEVVRNFYNIALAKFNINFPRKSHLETLIKVHLVNNDVDQAIEEYKRCIISYNIFPCMHLLMKKCIANGDFEKLQTIIDLTTMYAEKNDVLHELALIFIECGQYTQARKVIQTLGSRASLKHLEDICTRLFKDSKITELEQLLLATKDLIHIDRDNLFYYLLLLYAQSNDFEAALELWNTFQEENIQPSVKTLRLLAELLEKNDQPIPFVVPTGAPYLTQQNVLPVEVEPDIKSELEKCLESGNINELTDVLQKMKKGHIRSLSIDVMTKIIDLYASNEKLNDVSRIVQVMSYVLEKAHIVLKPLLEKYANSGDTKMMKSMLGFLPDFTLRSIRFNYFFHKAFLVSGKHEELLTELEEKVNKNIRLFSTGGFQELLSTAPHLEERALKLIETYASVEDFTLPRRMLWVHYFTHERYKEAEELLKKFPALFTNFDPLGTQVIKAVINTQNVTLGKKLISFLNDFDVKQVVRDRAYSCVLDILVKQNKMEEAFELLKNSQEQKIPLSHFNRTTLINLKDSWEKKGHMFPFAVVPEDSDSSSSDTD